MTQRARRAATLRRGNAALFHGDCMTLLKSLPASSVDLTVTSPPYAMGKAYERTTDISVFVESAKMCIPEIVRVTKDGGSICWQVGYHVRDQSVTPLDFISHEVFSSIKGMNLRNRIIWTFGHGVHCRDRFSGRHEVVLWYTKGDRYSFDLDAIRIPQKYPGKRHYKGPHKGQFSGNSLGKNPSDVWDIPNVKANHMEKTEHPCQFPVALAQRFVRALCPANGLVLDPYMGSASTGVAAMVEGRRFLGAEINLKYFDIALGRVESALSGTARYRDGNMPPMAPSPHMKVAQRPSHFRAVEA